MVAILAQGFLRNDPEYFWSFPMPDGRGTSSAEFNEGRLYDAIMIADEIIKYVGAKVVE